MVGLATDAAAMEIDAGVTIGAGRTFGPGKAELSAVGGKHGILALATWCELGCWLTGDGLLSFTVGWEMTRGAAMKTIRMLMLLRGLKRPIRQSNLLSRR
jgi:hypothetical protein